MWLASGRDNNFYSHSCGLVNDSVYYKGRDKFMRKVKSGIIRIVEKQKENNTEQNASGRHVENKKK